MDNNLMDIALYIIIKKNRWLLAILNRWTSSTANLEID
jgi:hypothetical protein